MQSIRPNAYSVFIHLAAAALAVLVLLVSSENRLLEAQLHQASTVQAGVEVGDPLPEVLVDDLEGRASRLSFAEQSEASVFLVFAPSCASCSENLPHWQELYERYGDRYRVLGVSVEDADSTRAYAEANALPFPIVIPRDASGFIESYGITQVPMTLVANGKGFAIDARVGVLPSLFSEDLERLVPAS